VINETHMLDVEIDGKIIPINDYRDLQNVISENCTD